MTLKRSSHFSKFDQWLTVNVIWKPDENINLDKLLFYFLWHISCIGRNEPVAVTTKVAVICLYHLDLWWEHFLTTLMKKCTFRRNIRKGCLIKIRNKLWRYIMTQYDTGNFSSSRKFLEGSTFWVVQFIDFKTLPVQFPVISRPPPNSFSFTCQYPSTYLNQIYTHTVIVATVKKKDNRNNDDNTKSSNKKHFFIKNNFFWVMK